MTMILAPSRYRINCLKEKEQALGGRGAIIAQTICVGMVGDSSEEAIGQFGVQCRGTAFCIAACFKPPTDSFIG